MWQYISATLKANDALLIIIIAQYDGSKWRTDAVKPRTNVTRHALRRQCRRRRLDKNDRPKLRAIVRASSAEGATVAAETSAAAPPPPAVL